MNQKSIIKSQLEDLQYMTEAINDSLINIYLQVKYQNNIIFYFIILIILLYILKYIFSYFFP